MSHSRLSLREQEFVFFKPITTHVLTMFSMLKHTRKILDLVRKEEMTLTAIGNCCLSTMDAQQPVDCLEMFTALAGHVKA